MATTGEVGGGGKGNGGGDGGNTARDQIEPEVPILGLETHTSILGEEPLGTGDEITTMEQENRGGDSRIEAAPAAEHGGHRLTPNSEQPAPVIDMVVASPAAAVVVGSVEKGGSGTGEAMGNDDRLAPVPAPAVASPAAAVVARSDGGDSFGTGTTLEGGFSGRGDGGNLHGDRGDRGNDDSGKDEPEMVHKDPSRGKQPADVGDSER